MKPIALLGLALIAYFSVTSHAVDPGPLPRQTAPPIRLPPVDFNHPPRDYKTHRVRDWIVLVEKHLVDDKPDLARRALERLDQKLGEALAALPKSSHERLKKLMIFLMVGSASPDGGRESGMAYFAKTAPTTRPHLDPRMASSVLIYSSDNFVKLSDFWALKALVHEFAHAQHLEQWPEKRADIFEVWENAKQTGLYRDVKNDKGGTLASAYALQNHLEYFAEISCAYFTGCNYHPFNRAGLKAYDPAGFALVEKLWGVPPGWNSTTTKPSRSSAETSPASESQIKRDGKNQ
jgi:hypothetical protein